jgi:hypothetical protein
MRQTKSFAMRGSSALSRPLDSKKMLNLSPKYQYLTQFLVRSLTFC